MYNIAFYTGNPTKTLFFQYLMNNFFLLRNIVVWNVPLVIIIIVIMMVRHAAFLVLGEITKPFMVIHINHLFEIYNFLKYKTK